MRTQPTTIQSKGRRGEWEDGWRGERRVGGLVGGGQHTKRAAHGTTSSRHCGRNAKCNAHFVSTSELAAIVTTSYRTGSTLMAKSGHELSTCLVWLAHLNTHTYTHTPRSLRATDVARLTHNTLNGSWESCCGGDLCPHCSNCNECNAARCSSWPPKKTSSSSSE